MVSLNKMDLFCSWCQQELDNSGCVWGQGRVQERVSLWVCCWESADRNEVLLFFSLTFLLSSTSFYMGFQPSACEFGDNTFGFMLTLNSPSQPCAFVKLFPLLGAFSFRSNWGNALHTSSLYVNFSSSKTCSLYSPLPASFKRDLLLQSCECMPCLVISMAVSACIPSAIHIIPLQGIVCARAALHGTSSIVYVPVFRMERHMPESSGTKHNAYEMHGRPGKATGL